MKAKKRSLSRLLQIPVVYTTRLEQMGFMSTPITTLNVTELFENIIQESKPILKSLKGLRRGRPRRSKRIFNNLLAIINDINERARLTKEQDLCATTASDVPLNFCEPSVHAKEIESNGDLYKQLNSIINEIQKNLLVSLCPSFIIYLLIKDCHTVVSDIYVAKSEASECKQDKDLSPETGKHVMSLDYCCWYDRKLKLELFFNYFLLNTPSFLYKPHDCEGVCNCCCSKLPHNNISHRAENSSEECNNLNSKQNRISNLNSHTPSASFTDPNAIDKSLRCGLHKSKELGTGLEENDSSVNPISVQLTDHRNKKITYYEIGANGKIEEYLKSYNSEGVSNTRDNAKIREDQSYISENTTLAENQESVYCWFARQNIYSKLVLEHIHVCENTIAFLTTLPPYINEKYDNVSESPINKNSVDKNSSVVISITFRKEPTISRMTFQTYKSVKYDQTKNRQSGKFKKNAPEYFTLNFSSDMETHIDSAAELVELAHNNNLLDEDEDLVEIIPDNITDPLLIENDTIPITGNSSHDVLNPLENNLPYFPKYSNENSVNDLDPLISNMPGPSNSDQVDPDSCGSLINSILSKFKGIRLDLDEKGNVKLCNTIASVWSKEDSEILEYILKLAQKEVDNLRMKSANTTTMGSPIVQTSQTKNVSSGPIDKAPNIVCAYEKLKPPDEKIDAIKKIILDFQEYSDLIYDREVYEHFTKITYMQRVLAMKPPIRNIHRITLNKNTSPGRKIKLKKITKAKTPKKSKNVSVYVKSKSNTIKKLKTISQDEAIIANKDQPETIKRKKLRKISESSNSSGDSSDSEQAVEISTLQWSTCSKHVQKDAVTADLAGDECNQTIPAVPLSLREKAHDNFRLSLAKTTELRTNSNKTGVHKNTTPKRRRTKNPLVVDETVKAGPSAQPTVGQRTYAAISQVHSVKNRKGLANSKPTAPVSNNLLRQLLIKPSSRFKVPNTHAKPKSTAPIAGDSVVIDDDYIVVDDDDL